MTRMAGAASTRLIIGMEIHVELATHTKMFSRSANVAHAAHLDAPPNTLIDPVSVGLPGALPVPNRQAIELAIMVGLALRCAIAPRSRFDRKNYFYPDLPKGYQISQYERPLCLDGALDIELEDGSIKRIGILRAHLEEDTGKLAHELPGGWHSENTLLDLNRAGTPLLEIVSQPDLATADEAVEFARSVHTICRYLGVTEGVMQRGHMRFEPNVNVAIEDEHGALHMTPIVEIKNLNSFKSLHAAIQFEFRRQVEAWKRDGLEQGPGMKSTRGWDMQRRVTVLQRSKEDAHDYRYFPEPDIPPIEVTESWLRDIRARMPELPAERRQRFVEQLGLTEKDARSLVADRDVCAFFERAADLLAEHGDESMTRQRASQLCAKLLLNSGARRANERECGLHELGISASSVADVLLLREKGRIGSNAADELFGLLCATDEPAEQVAARCGLLQVSDDDLLEEWASQAIAAQSQAAADYAAGKDAALLRLIGEVMKISKGRAKASRVGSVLDRQLRRH